MWEGNTEDGLCYGVTVPYGYVAEIYPSDGFRGTPLIVKGVPPIGEHDEIAECHSTSHMSVNSVIIYRDEEI